MYDQPNEVAMSAAVAAVALLNKIRKGFKLVALLQLTAYLFPQDARVNDHSILSTEFDFIIVGGGTSGCVIANRLTENENFKVLLIEAGEDPPLESVEYSLPFVMKGSHVDWNYTTENDNRVAQCHQYPYFEISSGKMLGGTSSLNFEYYARGNHRDYNCWAAIANDSVWSAKEVLPYFKKSERLEDSDIRNSSDRVYHGFEGYLGVTTSRKRGQGGSYDYLEGFKQLGNKICLDLNGNCGLGYADIMLTIANGHRQSSAYSFLRPIKNRPNLYVLKETLVIKIIFDSNKNAVGVQAITKDNDIITLKAKKEVIVSAGTLNTPKLLMLSGIGPKKHLQSIGIDVMVDLPVGKNLLDHVGTIVVVNLDELKKSPPPKDLTEFVLPATYGFVALNKSQKYPDYEAQNYYLDSAYNILNYCADFYRFTNKICDRMYKTNKGRNILVNVVSNLSPRSRGRVLLRSSNPRDSPVVYARYLSKDIDLENLAKYMKDLVRVVETPYFKSLGAEIVDLTPQCNNLERGSLEYYKCYVSCILISRGRFCGTCAIGSVVNSKLLVYGVNRLRVADASIMPTIPSSDITAPTIMIGEKVADMIKQDYK